MIEDTIQRLRKLSTQLRHRGKRHDVPKEWAEEVEKAVEELEDFTEGLKTSIANLIHVE